MSKTQNIDESSVLVQLMVIVVRNKIITLRQQLAISSSEVSVRPGASTNCGSRAIP